MKPVVVAVCVAYTPPSVRLVPWLFDVGGAPALGRLIERLTAFFAGSDCCVLNADVFREVLVRSIANARGVATFSTGSGALQHVVREFCERRSDVDSVLLFTDAAILPDCVESQRMLAKHHASGADVTLPDEALLDGLLPVVVKAASIPALFALYPQVSDVGALRAALRQRFPSERLIELRYSPDDHLSRDALQQLPACATLSDCWTRRAAEDAMTACAGLPDARAARLFKERLLALQDEVPVCMLRPSRDGARRVLYSSLRTAFSGGEQSLWTLIAHLDASRYAPAAILPFESLLAEKLRDAGVATQVAGWDYSLPTARNLRFCERVLDTAQPDIVHIDAQPNPALMVAACLRGVPIIGHLRICPHDDISPFTYLPDRIIAISEVAAARLRRFNIRPDRVVVIHNGVRPAANGASCAGWLHAQLGIPAAAAVFAVVSRISPTKRLEVVLDALAQVIEHAPDTYLVIVGEPSVRFGPYAQDDVLYAEGLKARVEARGLADRVRWLGFDANIDRLYGDIDGLIMCNPNEPFGRSAIEAFAHGVPVVGPGDGGALEIISHGVDGLFFDAGSVGELAAAMRRLLEDEPYRRMLGANARRSVERFSVERHVSEVEAVYDAVLASARVPRPVPSGPTSPR